MAFRSGEHRFREHALSQMATPGPALADFERSMAYGDIDVIEDYPEYGPAEPTYRPSMLIVGWLDGEAFHTVAIYPPNPLVITVYPPQREPEEWTPDFRPRRRAGASLSVPAARNSAARCAVGVAIAPGVLFGCSTGRIPSSSRACPRASAIS